MSGSLLIIDDEEQLRRLLVRILGLEGYEVEEAETLSAARKKLGKKSFDLVLCDVKLPDGSGVDFVKEIREKYPHPEMVLLTAFGNIPDGVQAIKNGAFDYLVKGNDNDRILPLLSLAMDKVKARSKAARQVVESNTISFSSVIGDSSVIQRTIALAKKIAPSDTTVLLLGETGTGKEVFAQAIHSASRRSANAFVAINCSAFSKDLLEGELFGHKAGAYTGAVKDRKGLLEMADKGTLFLDEIGELNIDLQAKLLRVLENGEFIKLGDTKTSTIDVRIIAATNRDLQKEISEGRFREDLYYRLNVFGIALPPLRERREDIGALAQFFLHRAAGKSDTKELRVSKEALALLQQYGWKGNIRELRNIMERASVIAEGKEVLPSDLPYEVQKEQAGGSTLSLAAVERAHIQKVLAHTGGNKTETARLLDIGLTTLYRKIEEYKLTT